MSDMKKWMKIVNESQLTAGRSVILSDEIGGGAAQLVSCGEEICVVDIKGNIKEVPTRCVQVPCAVGTDVIDGAVDVKNVNVMPGNNEILRDRPNHQTGDMVRVDNVYGSTIGPGFGVFMSYSTDGKSGIVSFDDRVITVPVNQITAVVEQSAEDEFASSGNDGAMSPLTLNQGDVEQGNIMSKLDNIAHWMKTIDDSLKSITSTPSASCNCCEWDCDLCFPQDVDDIIELTIKEDADLPDAVVSGASPDVSEMIGKIQYMQDVGLSASNTHYDIEKLMYMEASAIERIYNKVMGNVQESGNDMLVPDQVLLDDDIQDDGSAKWLKNLRASQTRK